MSNTNKAIEILARTNDGNLLSRRDLAIVELAVNGRLGLAGEALFEMLHETVLAGTYDASKQYLFGIEHLTRDGQGYVQWKGRTVEHYSHSDPQEMERDAKQLAARCLALEAKGFPVTGRAVIEPMFAQAPADTPWLQAMQSFYTLFVGDDRHVAILYRNQGEEVLVLERLKETGELCKTSKPGAYEAFHFVQNQGLKSISPLNDYDTFVNFFNEAALTPHHIQQALAGF